MDQEPPPPGGYPMRWAITALATGDGGRAWAELYQFDEDHRLSRGSDAPLHLWLRLIDRACAGEVVVRGVRDGLTEPVTIDPGILHGSVPDMDRDTLIAAGITWHSIRVRLATETGGTEIPTATTKQTASKRQPEHGDDFIQEMLRFANTPNGFEARKQLETHMKQWCQQRDGDQAPENRTIERWVKRYSPPELPDK